MAEMRPGETVTTLPDTTDAGVFFIGAIETPWKQRSDCPRQGDAEAGPVCRIVVAERWRDALENIQLGDRIQVLYWMHEGRRDLTRQTPRNQTHTMGTFALRSPNRPNPIASSIVIVTDLNGATIEVRGLDCLDGTALLDIKPEYCPHGHVHGEHHHSEHRPRGD